MTTFYESINRMYNNYSKKAPLVSILIPVFNRVQLISDCIRSAQEQTIRDIEIIVVDNASDDGTYEVCQNLAQRDERIKIYRNDKNIGPVQNWLRCLEKAQGHFAKLLFSDDTLYENYLGLTIPMLKDKSVGFVFTAVDIGPDPDNVFRNEYKWNNKNAISDSIDFVKAIFFREDVPISPGSALFRLDDMKKNLLVSNFTSDVEEVLKYGAGSDLLLFLITASKYPKVAHVQETLAFFRYHSGSITVDKGMLIKKLYWQAKIWFLGSYLNGSFLNKEVLAKAWVELSLANRQIISKEKMKKLFPSNKYDLSLKLIILEFVKFSGYLVLRRLSIIKGKLLCKIRHLAY